MIEYTKDGLVTDEPQIKLLSYQVDGSILRQGGQTYSVFGLLADDLFLIPWPIVWEAIQPIEDDAVFIWPIHRRDEQQPTYRWDGDSRSLVGSCSVDSVIEGVLKVCAMTIGKSVGELRELVGWCKEGKDGE